MPAGQSATKHLGLSEGTNATGDFLKLKLEEEGIVFVPKNGGPAGVRFSFAGDGD